MPLGRAANFQRAIGAVSSWFDAYLATTAPLATTLDWRRWRPAVRAPIQRPS
jgi:hypothetical protein